QREEEVLFPQLEKYGVYGPPQIMVMEHTALRTLKKELNKMAESEKIGDFNKFKEKFSNLSRELVANLRDHIFKENNILYPAALKVVPKAQWKKIGADADKIGYCCFTPQYKPVSSKQ
ncbi:MAG TPA: hemerythrin domain-containing protein, partial [Patescibacteria group bacterium]|nr:hemerythrin domain-containing protein [Patescibacteria group bacterium]